MEILHIDTSGSRRLYSDMSPIEKAASAKMLKDFFEEKCEKCGGRLHSWAGDGGFALFRSSMERQVGASIRAAEQFLHDFPSLNAKTARAHDLQSFHRSVRLKAHRGELYVTSDQGIDSADPQHFDDFLKHEKKFAPQDNEFFVTEALYHVLPQPQKKRFELFKATVSAGSIRTPLYRLRRQPVAQADDIFRHGDQVSSITQAEWNYLRTQIHGHFANVAARNQITKGLIGHLDRFARTTGGSIRSDVLLQLTLDALSSYLPVAFERHRIRVSYWRAVEDRGGLQLKMVAFRYPNDETTDPARRVVAAKDTRFKICEAFAKQEPVVTPSVFAARLKKEWFDFDTKQPRVGRALASALQIPVYCEGAHRSKVVKGVLSLDADRADMFLPDELPLWRDDLVGFLANIALAEKLRECET